MPRLFLGTWFLSFERFSRREGNGLDLVSIQISEKGAAIVGIVVFTYTGRAFVNRTISNGAFIELEPA
jgi:hypothetical protein